MKDWLGNELVVGDEVLYTSKSTHTGMNKGELVTATPEKIQVRIPIEKWTKASGEWQKVPGTQVVTLLKHNGAFHSVTKWFGPQ